MSAVLNSDGSAVIDGVRLSAAQVSALKSAKVVTPTVARPITIVTGSGKSYGKTGPPRYGIAYDVETGSFHWLDANWEPIPNGAWRPRNLNKMKLTFTAGS